MGTNVKCGGKTGTGPLKVRGGTGQLPDVPVGPAAPPAPPGPAAPVAGRNAGAGAPPAGRAAKSRLTFVPASLAGALGGMAPAPAAPPRGIPPAGFAFGTRRDAPAPPLAPAPPAALRSAPPGAAAPIGVLAAAPGIPPAATGTAPAAPGGPAAGPGTGALPAAPQLSPAAAAVYANLSRSQKASYDKLYQIVKSADSADLPALKATEGLDRLLADKTLLKGDRTILKILAEHAGRPLPPALSRQGLTPEGQMRNIVNMLAYPDSVSQGKSSNTCVVAALQSIAAADYPRTFAKMATELIWDGTYTRGKGVRIPLSTSELGKAGGAAMTTSELIQGSLREFAKGIPPVGADFGAGRYGARGQYGGGRYGAKAGYGAGAYSAPATGQVAEGGEPVPGGLTAYQAEKLYERVLGQSAVSVEVDDKNRENVWKNITRKLEKGRDVSVGVTGTDEAEKPVLHQVTLVRMEGDKVWVRDSGRGNAQPYDSAMVKASLLTAVLPGDLVNYKTFNVLSNPAMPIDADAVPEPLVDAGAGNDGADSGYSGFPFPDFYS